MKLSVSPPDVDRISWAGTNLQGQGTGMFPRRKRFASYEVNMISFKENFYLFFFKCLGLLKGKSLDFSLEIMIMMYLPFVKTTHSPPHTRSERPGSRGTMRPILHSESVAQPEIELSKLPNS